MSAAHLNKKTVCVICPAYNEEEVIETFYNELARVLNTVKDQYDAEMLFVVDLCTDRTVSILKEISGRDGRVKIIALSSRFGHQMSLLAGIDHSKADATIMLDSDLQHPPGLIPSMLAEFEKGFDIVYTIRQDLGKSSYFRRVTSQLFYRLINKISQVPIHENAADFRLISRKVVRVFQSQIRERNQFLRGLVGWVGFKRSGLVFNVGERGGGSSKYSISRLIRFAVEGVVSFSKRPLQAAVYCGLVTAFIGIALSAVTFADYFINSHLPSGWTTLVIIISGFSGVQMIFLGVIGQYIGAIFDEVKARPHYIIDEKVNFDE